MDQQFINSALELVKARKGMSTTVRDSYITKIVEGVVTELEQEKGLLLDSKNSYHMMFVVDFATWRYDNRGEVGGTPRHLQYRLHNLMLHVGSKNLRVDQLETVDTLPLSPNLYTVYILDADDSKQMYIKDTWTLVDLVNGVWVAI